MNVLTITGNVCNDLELRDAKTANGPQKVCNIRIAENSYIGGKQVTTFFSTTAWGTSAENACKYLAKGSHIAVTGSVGTEEYDAKDGGKRMQLVIRNSRIEFGPRTVGKTDDPNVVAKIPSNKEPEPETYEDDQLPF